MTALFLNHFITGSIPIMKRIFFSVLFFFVTAALVAEESVWPPIAKETRPWGYTWIMGGALDEENLRWKLGQFHDAGLGGMHIIPIYGAKSYEDRYVEFMSQKWLGMVRFAVKEADSLGMGVDVTLGTGWCFGGPMVVREDANMTVKFEDKGGEIEIVPKYNARAVKRAAPGGEGQMLNPYSVRAATNYVHWFEEKLKDHDGPLPRAIYHDSYEYANNWSDDLFEYFEKRRGYKLEGELNALAGNGNEDRIRRVKADYRKTVAEMHLDFTKTWTDWGRKHGMISRNEAHGSPGNLLDVYAAADVPETEFFAGDKNPLIAKFASSAAHISGRKLVASESGTWVKEHFHETLGDIKTLFDGFFVSGVNHVFYHGTVYSPQDVPWPGWLFYASTQMNPQNSIWRDAKYLNEYIARCQSVLQAGEPDNDILLYWPIDDLWHRKDGLQIDMSVHNIAWFKDQPVGELAEFLWKNGYQFDYISDAQLQAVKTVRGNQWSKRIVAPGGKYRAIIVPRCEFMTPETMEKLLEIAGQRIPVLFDGPVPSDVPGLGNLDERRRTLAMLKEGIEFPAAKTVLPPPRPVDSPEISPGPLLEPRKPKPVLVVDMTECRRETLRYYHIQAENVVAQTGVKLIRRELDGDVFYFITNTNDQMEHSDDVRTVEGWFSLKQLRAGQPVVNVFYTDGYDRWFFSDDDLPILMDPMTGQIGLAKTRKDRKYGTMEVYLQMKPNQSMILRVCRDIRTDNSPTRTSERFGRLREIPDWIYCAKIDAEPLEPTLAWHVEFLEGGPEFPAARNISELKSWTEWSDPLCDKFAGTAKYSTTFELPRVQGDETYQLDLGDLSQSARIQFNGRNLGCLFVKPYIVTLPPELLKTTGNALEIEVTNLSANRIRDLDRNKVDWKIFHDINIVNINYKKFDAANWPPHPSGLMGPVRFIAVQPLEFEMP